MVIARQQENITNQRQLIPVMMAMNCVMEITLENALMTDPGLARSHAAENVS